MVSKAAPAQAQAHGYEFGGPLGAFGVSFGLPLVVYLFTFTCNDISGCPAPSLLSPSTFTLDKFAREIGWTGWETIFSWQAFAAVFGYYVLTFVLYAILPAQEVEGVVLRGGGRLKYRMNTFNTMMAILTVLAAGTAVQGADFFVWTFISDNYARIVTSNLIISFTLACYVYINSFAVQQGKPTKPAKRELALGGVTGNIMYDWFIGRELNPPVWIPFVGYVEIKSYMELRPGMMGWLILDLAFVAKQYRNYGRVTDSILLTTFTQGLYVLDSFWNEPAILTTIDITSDGFGFMLSFGDLVWVPHTYTLQARYLSVYPVDLGVVGIAGIVAVQLVGYYIFRAANSQKNAFRTNPNDPAVKHLTFIQTKKGSKLITNGWWGSARHINYLGDWLMSWAYCLPTAVAGYVIQPSSPFRTQAGLDSAKAALIKNDRSLTGGLEVVPGDAYGWGMLITYFYMVYFAILLIHRERRDDEKCRRQYGKDWEEYCKKVPSRIIPGVY